MSESTHRREFLERLGIGTAGLILGGYTGTAKGFAANETINVGCIGTGGRCRFLMNALGRVPGNKIVAVCDVWDEHLNKAKQIADSGAFTTKDYHELLSRKDIDAVLIASPDHWHVPMTIDAMAAGKDVYVEKPLTHDPSEGDKILAAQEKYNKVVQVGTQQRSMPHMIEGNKLIRAGKLGDIHKVHLTWNRNSPRGQKTKYGIDPRTVDWKKFLGNAKDQPFDEYRFRQWRWFWDFGGGILTDLMVHHLDIANWVLDLDHPSSATTIGDHFMAEGLWETPDTIQTLMRYPDRKVQVYFEGTFVNARNRSMIEIMGSDATLYLDRGRYELHPERHRRIKYQEMVLGEGIRGADHYKNPDSEALHLSNWLECIRSKKTPNAPISAGVKAAAAAHLANRAYLEGKVARWES